jgi:hypothetical protein
MKGPAPFVVLCWETDPSYVPPFRVSPHQFTIGLRYQHAANFTTCNEPPDIVVPAGVAYDLEATMRQAGVTQRPDLIVVWGSALGANRPANLGAFRCPKLLLCGDTHHTHLPIRSLIDYARAEAFDAVASTYDRHHLHWFLSAGFSSCAWLPGITARHLSPPWVQQRIDQVAFVGQMGAHHGWRNLVLERIAAAGIPLQAGRAPREHAAVLYGQSLASFNASLNGDLNMRVFEVLSAGGFLLTDRLSPQAGLELLLRPGQDCETYTDAGELIDKLAFYRRMPAAALRIAEHGAATYQRELMAEHGITALREWMLDGRLPDRLNPRHDLRIATSQKAARQLDLRLAAYEMLQEQQRLRPGLSVLVSPGWSPASVLDLADLVRTRVSVIGPAPALYAAAASASVLEQVAFVETDAAMHQDWDMLLTTSLDGASEPWRSRAANVIFADFGEEQLP